MNIIERIFRRRELREKDEKIRRLLVEIDRQMSAKETAERRWAELVETVSERTDQAKDAK